MRHSSLILLLVRGGAILRERLPPWVYFAFYFTQLVTGRRELMESGPPGAPEKRGNSRLGRKTRRFSLFSLFQAPRGKIVPLGNGRTSLSIFLSVGASGPENAAP